MLNLITAVPGSGKTLYVIDTVRKEAQVEIEGIGKRQVYYHGIPLTELGKAKLDWIELEDPKQWHDLPKGSIIVIDECQKHFGVRRSGSEVPKYIADFAVHRHKGFDVWLITQGPKLLDAFIRELVNKHHHLRRIMGAPAADLLKWDCCEISPNSTGAASRSADKRVFAYPKDVYPLYKSAEVHTHRFQLPKGVRNMLLIFLVLPVLAFIGYKALSRLGGTAPTGEVAGQAAPKGSAMAPEAKTAVLRSASDVVAAYTPAVPDRPETAPRYQEIARPVTFPRLQGCIASRTRCTCYTQQATVLDVPDDVCQDVASRGRFDEFAQPAQERQVAEGKQQGQGGATSQGSPAVVTMGDATGGMRIPGGTSSAGQGNRGIPQAGTG